MIGNNHLVSGGEIEDTLLIMLICGYAWCGILAYISGEILNSFDIHLTATHISISLGIIFLVTYITDYYILKQLFPLLHSNIELKADLMVASAHPFVSWVFGGFFVISAIIEDE